MSSDTVYSLPDLIAIKRDGRELSPEQIKRFIDSVSSGEADGSQIGAMLMAMFLNGLNTDETVGMTREMMNSGETLSWPTESKHLVVDKHSTGGVGDKVSLPLAPALAACGLKVPMISGRSLGHTGGTLDKLESIPGFKITYSAQEIQEQVNNVGCCIVGQTKDLVPADKSLYAVRDVTATVECDPLIVASIISKKAAEGIGSLVMDIKCGRAGWKITKTLQGAQKLAHSLINTAEGLGIKTTAVITEINNPIGWSVGNSLEVEESILCLQGKGPSDLRELVCELGAQLLISTNKAETAEQGAEMIKTVLDNGKALQKFQEMLTWQGVKEDIAKSICTPGNDLRSILPIGKIEETLTSRVSGRVKSIDALEFGCVMCEIGVGRTSPDQDVDHGVGAYIHVSVGQCIEKNAKWCTIYHNGRLTEENKNRLLNAIEIEEGILEEKPQPSRKLEILTKSSTLPKKDVFVSQ